MGSEEHDDGFVLNAFLGDRNAILRLSEFLGGAAVLEVCAGVIFLPFTPTVRHRVQVGDRVSADFTNWPFRSMDIACAVQCAAAAGDGRIAYLEAFGYKDTGHEFGIGWQDGLLRLGPVADPWHSARGGSIEQIASFLRATPDLRRKLLSKGRIFYKQQEYF